jgi:GlpG protein
VTLIIAAVAVALELASTFDDMAYGINAARREYFAMGLRLGMLSPVWSGELWRPFTATLLHGSLLHAAFNVYWLVVFGGVLEPRFGSGRYLGLLVLLGSVCSMTSFLISNLDTPLDGQISGLGLSGIIYGLFGILWMGRRWRREFQAVCDADTVRLFVAWFFVCIVITYLDFMPIDNIAHGAGWALGTLYGLAMFDPKHPARWVALAAACSILILATMIACPGHPLYEKHKANELIKRHLQELRQEAPPDRGDAP